MSSEDEEVMEPMDGVVRARDAAAKIIDLQKDLTWLGKFAKKLRREQYYGDLVLHYQNGRVVNAELLTSIKPDEF